MAKSENINQTLTMLDFKAPFNFSNKTVKLNLLCCNNMFNYYTDSSPLGKPSLNREFNFDHERNCQERNQSN